jgi:hypothetical protein
MKKKDIINIEINMNKIDTEIEKMYDFSVSELNNIYDNTDKLIIDFIGNSEHGINELIAKIEEKVIEKFIENQNYNDNDWEEKELIFANHLIIKKLFKILVPLYRDNKDKTYNITNSIINKVKTEYNEIDIQEFKKLYIDYFIDFYFISAVYKPYIFEIAGIIFNKDIELTSYQLKKFVEFQILDANNELKNIYL